MSKLQSMLAAKSAEGPVINSSSPSSDSTPTAQAGIPSPTVQNLAASESIIQTGMESVTMSADTKNDPSPISLVEAELDERYKDYPEKSFLMIRQRNLITSNGSVIKPDANGVITAKDESQLETLNYWEEQNVGLVRRIA